MRSRAPLIAVMLTLLLAVAVVLVWGRTMFSSVAPVSQGELEDQVASSYTPDNPGDDLAVSCDGELAPEVDATQACAVQVGADVARVHVVVEGVDGNDVRFASTPYLPADAVADSIKASLEDRNVTVDAVECAGELLGVKDSTTTCTTTPSDAGGELEARVTLVEGLVIHFQFEETR